MKTFASTGYPDWLRRHLAGPRRSESEIPDELKEFWAFLASNCQGADNAKTYAFLGGVFGVSPQTVRVWKVKLTRLYGKPIASISGGSYRRAFDAILGKVRMGPNPPMGVFVPRTRAEVVAYVNTLNCRIQELSRLKQDFMQAAREFFPPEQLKFEDNEAAEPKRVFLGPQ